MDFSSLDINNILAYGTTAVIALLATVPVIIKYKSKITALVELVHALIDALSDGKLTEDEVKQIVADAKSVLAAFGLSK